MAKAAHIDYSGHSLCIAVVDAVFKTEPELLERELIKHNVQPSIAKDAAKSYTRLDIGGSLNYCGSIYNERNDANG